MISPYLSFMNDKYSKDVDLLINKILDEEPKVEAGKYYTTFYSTMGKIEIWTSNKWYAYACKGGFANYDQIYEDLRPRRRTMVRMAKYITSQGDYNQNKLLHEIVKDIKD